VDADQAAGPAPEVVCLGHAIVDWVSFVEHGTAEKVGLLEGSMNLVDRTEADRIGSALPEGWRASGGSAANTAAGIASLGGRPVFVGAVGEDVLGEGYAADLESVGVDCVVGVVEEDIGTGRCLVLVTPDADRTMATYLGAAPCLDPRAVESAGIESAGAVYLEGYLLDPPEAAAAIAKAKAIAGEAGRKMALSLSDPFVVERHHAALVELIDELVDVLFCNEDEACALTRQPDAAAAATAMRRDGLVLFITRGEKGVLVVSSDERIEVPAVQVPNVVDTTGAGDLFAAGALFGLVRGADLERAAALGSLAAAEVISHAGARPLTPLRDLAAEAGLQLL
jgi:sugar/nucleoside kinase (ribokinase family)